jgi:hypothetical protein
MELSLAELEAAINWWRRQRPACGDEGRLSPPVAALATLYALMIYRRIKTVPLASLDPPLLQLLDAWRQPH